MELLGTPREFGEEVRYERQTWGCCVTVIPGQSCVDAGMDHRAKQKRVCTFPRL